MSKDAPNAPSKGAKPGEKPDPTVMFANVAEMMEKVGGPDSVFGRMEVAERRSEAMNLKLNILLEHAGIDWKKDARYAKMKAGWDARDGKGK